MSQLNSYLEALLPKPVEVLGFHLKPFCLGHLNLMQRYGCSFIDGFPKTPEGAVKYISDFLLAVFICAMSYEEAKVAFETDTITVKTKRFFKNKTFTVTYKKASFSEYLTNWNKEFEAACNTGKVDLLFELGKMQGYIKDAFAGPESYPIEDGERSTFKSGAPWEQSFREFLLTKYSESEAMNLSLALGLWEWSKEAENNRQIGIKSEGDQDAIRILKEMAAH